MFTVVIGPAEDGGYYLIGMKKLIAELFTGLNGRPIPWSTSTVFQYSLDICRTLGLSFFTELPSLNDIDNPEDLVHLEAALRNHREGNHSEKISIIIPVLNEEATLQRTLERASMGSVVEIIVVDGGSTDSTLTVANTFRLQHTDVQLSVVNAQKGRSKQQVCIGLLLTSVAEYWSISCYRLNFLVCSR